ncbi:unnamed protein product, partial [Sphagnum tenellum]
MAALLRWTPTILNDAHINGPTVCMRRRNLLQTLELHNSSWRASQLKAFSDLTAREQPPVQVQVFLLFWQQVTFTLTACRQSMILLWLTAPLTG